MKIAWIVNNINQMGGIERVVCGLSGTFASYFGYSVEIISINSFEDQLFFPLHESVGVRHCKLDWREETFSRLSKLIGEILTELDADVVLTCHPTISYAAVCNKRKLRGKLVVTQHNSNAHFRKIKLWLNAFLYRYADKFVVLTTSDRNSYSRMGCKAEVIPNACFNAVTEPSRLDNKQILAVGRIEQVKGFDMLIDAFSMVSPNHPEWKLCICGGGTVQEELRLQAARLGISDKVIFPGQVKEMDDYYRNSSVFALSSRNEGFALVLIEAMSYGLPVVSFELPSIADIIGEEECLVAPQGDVQKFAEYLNCILSDEALRVRLGQKARELANKYTPVNVAEHWITLFGDIGVDTQCGGDDL